MALAAKDHCLDLGKSGSVGHYGTDSSSEYDRIERYGEASWKRSENLSYTTRDPMEILVDFIIEEESGTGHQKRLWNPDFSITGSYSCPHSKHKYATVVTYASAIELNEKSRDEI